MYTSIYNPETKKSYNIRSPKGIETLRNFMMIGGAKNPCNRLKKNKDPKCTDHKECKWVKILGCKNKETPIKKQKKIKIVKKKIVKKKVLTIRRDDVGRQVLHDEAAMVVIKQFRHKQKLKITDEDFSKASNRVTKNKYDKHIEKELNQSGLLSYLYFENGEIKIDKISPKNRLVTFLKFIIAFFNVCLKI